MFFELVIISLFYPFMICLQALSLSKDLVSSLKISPHND